jgi:hypothetical protein
MATFNLPDHFNHFFKRLNPSPSFERQASSEYGTIKGLLEDRRGPAAELWPVCFLQGSYKQDTAIYTINDVDIVALANLSYPGSGGAGKSYSRDEIFRILAAPLLADGRYRGKMRFHNGSMCIKVDLGIKVEILPAVLKSGTTDTDKEPFCIHRPGKGWGDAWARYHQHWLTWKNRSEATGGNFIPTIKVLKHLRSQFRLDAVSFHIECLLFALPDHVFRGSIADCLAQVLTAIALVPAATWYGQILRPPCGEDRDIFSEGEWGRASWEAFHKAVELWAKGATNAVQARDRDIAIEFWRITLSEDFFPRDVSV